MDGEQLSAVTMEWKVLKERFFAGEPVDPVFEGIVKDFISFDVTLQDIFKKVEVFMKGGVKLQDELKKKNIFMSSSFVFLNPQVELSV